VRKSGSHRTDVPVQRENLSHVPAVQALKGREVMASARKPWSLTGSARAARDARVAVIRYMRTSPVERAWHASILARGHESRTAAGAGNPEAARALFFSTMGYPPPYPGTWDQASAVILADEARYLSQADLYVLTPQMLAVVAAAAQTLSYSDLRLLRADDLPGPTGLLVLPQPLRLRLPTGTIEEAHAYTWRLPWRLPLPAGQGFAGTELPAVRLSSYVSARRADADFRRQARRLGPTLPPFVLDCTWSLPLHPATAAQQHDQERLEAQLHRLNSGYWEQEIRSRTAAADSAGEYTLGSAIDEDQDGTFGSRFLYAFWRMCEQKIAAVTPAETRHAARTTAARAGVSPDVRIVTLRRATSRAAAPSQAGHVEWQHHWVVRMHKVNQWYPSLGQHRILFRGPYLKGPADKPLLGGDVVRGLVR
jgi:hypothetical protein